MTTELTYDLTEMKSVLSKIAAFRTWCGASTEAAALAKIFLFSVEDVTLPACVIAHGPGWQREAVTFAAYSTMPEIVIEFLQSVNKGTTNQSAFTTLATSISAIMAGIESQSAAGSGYGVPSWRLNGEDTPSRGKLSGGTDYVSMKVLVSGSQR